MLRVLVLTGGHPFDRPSFNDMLDALPDVWWEEVAHPEAQARLAPGRVGADVVLAYDLPGVTFRPGQPPLLPAPSPELVAGMEGLLDEGQPFVFLHHALASWPAWPEFAEIVGGRYHYAPATLRGHEWPDSGYRHDVHQTLRVVAPDHPVCAGLPESFELTDETYLCPVFDDDVVPLVVSDAPRTDQDHWSTTLALAGRRYEREGWHHPPGSPLAAWVKRSGRSPVAYVQPGDGPAAFENAAFRQLLANALHWAASDEARRWAAQVTA
jgi:uncharacterized protein